MGYQKRDLDFRKAVYKLSYKKYIDPQTVSKALNISLKSARYHLKKLKYVFVRQKAIEIMKLYDAKVSLSSIQLILKLSRDTILNTLKKHRQDFPYRKRKKS